MPESQQPVEGQQLMVDIVKEIPNARILDVGPGEGKWSRLLRDLPNVATIDGVEIWEPYVAKYDLLPKYDTLHVCDIQDFPMWKNLYDVVIMGDVLEHLHHDKAVALVEKMRGLFKFILLSLPVSLCVQDGRYYGNPYETHHYQWKPNEVEELGFKELHIGPNPNGLVQIGTYVMERTEK